MDRVGGQDSQAHALQGSFQEHRAVQKKVNTSRGDTRCGRGYNFSKQTLVSGMGPCSAELLAGMGIRLRYYSSAECPQMEVEVCLQFQLHTYNYVTAPNDIWSGDTNNRRERKLKKGKATVVVAFAIVDETMRAGQLMLLWSVVFVAVCGLSMAQMSNTQAIGLYTYVEGSCVSNCGCCLVSKSPDDSSLYALGINITPRGSSHPDQSQVLFLLSFPAVVGCRLHTHLSFSPART